MRLLRCTEDGELQLLDLYAKDIPPYAILSHTWGDPRDEVTFDDILEGVGDTKAGAKKIRLCADQASKDGLQFFWIDTCCINRSSSVELSTAINSMFRRYRNAARCYVYLSDVSVDDSTESSQRAWRLAFRRSRWFTRGWTLQELLAPASVEFFSAEWIRLGNKLSLGEEIRDVTGIPMQALRGTPLSQFSIEERLSWAAGRQTSIAEDAIYSLWGIFDVHLSPIYGEGREHAGMRFWEILEAENRRKVPSLRQDWAKAAGFTFDTEEHEDIPTGVQYISSVSKTETDEARDKDSDDNSDIASIFSDGGISASSASSTGLNPVQTTGIQEVTRALLSQEELKALYTMVVHSIERRKARAHIRGFLREYGRNLLKEARNSSLENQAATFVQALAGRIADEISWSITGFGEESSRRGAESGKEDLEVWLSSLQPESSSDAHEDPTADDDEVFEDNSDDEPDDSVQFPNIDNLKDFLLKSEAFRTLVTAMRTWLKIDAIPKSRQADMLEKPAGNISTQPIAKEATGETHHDLTASDRDQPQTPHSDKPATGVENSFPQDPAEEPKSRFAPRQKSGSASDLIVGLLNYFGVTFFFYDLIELFVPRVRAGYKRLRWRCSCNTVLWGDFPEDEDDHSLDQLKRELSWWSMPTSQRKPSGGTPMSRPTANPDTRGSGAIQVGPLQSTASPLGLGDVRFAGSSSQTPTKALNPSLSEATHIVNIFPPRYFEVCINIGNYAIDHHEIDISRITSDSELFELIWDKYNSSRGIGLRRLFLRPRSVHFVMFSVSRRTQYGAGIHKKPDEFPPQKELDGKRYHYLRPKIRMPVNVFLHYLHRARWNIWGEHTEDIWLQRLPKKLNESILAQCRQDDASSDQDEQEAIADPNLAFGWGVHILHGPNHAVLGFLLSIGIAVAFVVSGMVVGFAKTQEQGFGIGSFLLTIVASAMAAVYFQLQDQ